MSDPREFEPPKPDKADAAHTLARAVIGSVPVVGGAAVEFFTALLTPSIIKRRQKWMEEIAEGLRELKREKGVRIDDLKHNEGFITTVMHATQAAMRNHQKEKLEALRNAVLNTSLDNAPDEDVILMFLTFVDTLTISHLKILELLNDPSAWVKKYKISYDISDSPTIVLEKSFPELVKRRKYYDLLAKDLYSRGLIHKDTLNLTADLYGILARQTTYMGRQFMDFITSPLEEINQNRAEEEK